MALQGDLKSINLGNVLQDIAANALTGTLTLTMRRRVRRFWFEKGKLRLVGLDNGKGPSPLNGLLALGKVKPKQVKQGGADSRVLRDLVKRCVVTEEDVGAGLAHQMTEFACDVFAWGEARFEFADGEPADDSFTTSQLDLDVRLPADPVIMEAARRMDEWGEIRKAVFSAEEILLLPPDRQPPEGDPVVERVAGMLDGARSLRDILDETHLGEFAVLGAAATLLRAGAARALTAEEAGERARAALKGRRYGQALRMARFGLERLPSNVDLLDAAAAAHEGLDETEEAASARRKLAAAQVAAGDREKALETYRKVVALAPGDTFAQEGIFELLLELERKAEAAKQGEALAAAYRKAGLPDETKGVFTRLMRAFGDDDGFLEQAAETALRLGEKKEALVLTRRLWERALEGGDRKAILARGAAVLKLDADAGDVARRLKDVESGAFDEERRLARRTKLLVALAIVLTIVVPSLVYELRSRSSLSAVRKEAITRRKEGEELLRLYNGFLDDYGWCLSAPDAKKERNEVEDAWVEASLMSPEKVDGLEERQLLAAAEQTRLVRDLARQDASKSRAGSVLGRIEGRVTGAGDRFAKEAAAWAAAGTAQDLARIAALVDPLALRAAQQSAGHGNVAVRRAAVAALGGQPSVEAFGTLVKRFAAEGDPGVRSLVREEMKRRTGKDAGEDADKWQEQYRRALAEQKPGLIPPLNASLVRVSEVVEGQPLVLEWRLENFGTSPVAFHLAPRLEVVADPARPLKVDALPGGPEARRIELRAGEFLGGRFDARKVVEGLGGPGVTYTFVWTARVQWGSAAAEVPVESVGLKVHHP
jgi:tetratricopeptide (TPR) repeat protein